MTKVRLKNPDIWDIAFRYGIDGLDGTVPARIAANVIVQDPAFEKMFPFERRAVESHL